MKNSGTAPATVIGLPLVEMPLQVRCLSVSDDDDLWEGDSRRRWNFNLHTISPDTGLGTQRTQTSDALVCMAFANSDSLHEKSRRLRGRLRQPSFENHETPQT